jgi:lipopolysaccharide export system protein LptC
MTLHIHFRNWLLLLPFLGLLGITYWLDQQTQPELARTEIAKRHEPDAIVDNFSATRLNDQGTPRFIMTAKKMQHFPDDDSSTLEMPRLTSLSAEHPSIHASAEQGVITNKGDEVLLHGAVEILSEATTQQDKITLRTESLRILPDQGFLNTDRAVTVVDAHHTLYAIGLEMDNRASTLKLLSQVRSEYVPIKK